MPLTTPPIIVWTILKAAKPPAKTAKGLPITDIIDIKFLSTEFRALPISSPVPNCDQRPLKALSPPWIYVTKSSMIKTKTPKVAIIHVKGFINNALPILINEGIRATLIVTAKILINLTILFWFAFSQFENLSKRPTKNLIAGEIERIIVADTLAIASLNLNIPSRIFLYNSMSSLLTRASILRFLRHSSIFEEYAPVIWATWATSEKYPFKTAPAVIAPAIGARIEVKRPFKAPPHFEAIVSKELPAFLVCSSAFKRVLFMFFAELSTFWSAFWVSFSSFWAELTAVFEVFCKLFWNCFKLSTAKEASRPKAINNVSPTVAILFISLNFLYLSYIHYNS